MPVITSFCSVFSIRLGSVIVGGVCLLQALLLEIGCVVGLQNLRNLSQAVTEFANEKDLLFLTSSLNSFKKNPEPYLTALAVSMAIYSFSCVLLILGALKVGTSQHIKESDKIIDFKIQLSITFVTPFVVLELLRQIVNGSALIAGLLVLKNNSLDLGPIMGGSIGTGFFMLSQLYLWACPLSLLQELMRLRRRALQREPDPLETKLWQRIPPYATYPIYPVYIE